MNSITLAVSRPSGSGDYVVELYRWRGGVREEKPAAREALPAALFEPGGALDVAAIQRFFLETEDQDSNFRVIGCQMWSALHTGSVAAEWDRAIQEVEEAIEEWEAQSPAAKATTPRPAGLRTYLQVDDSLAALPWELMRSTHDLFLISDMPVLRAEKRKFIPRSDAAVWPIRVLVVVGAGEAEAASLKADEELEAIREVLRESEHLFDLAILETRRRKSFTPADLKIELQTFRPHIFHFIGHGRTDGGTPRLEICDAQNKHDWTSAQIELDIRTMGGVLRLAFLNACRTALPKHSDFFSIAQAFFRGRALSVLAMQADVSGEAARICTRRFYSELVNGRHIDGALAAARDMLHAAMGADTRHAFVPVLSVAAAPEHILDCPRRARVSAPGLDEVRRCFVDRVEERRLAIHSMAQSEIARRHCSAVVLKGQEEKVGKTWLQMWLLHALAQNRYGVHAIEAFDKTDWLQFVLALAEGSLEMDDLAQPLAPEVRQRFYEDVARLAGIAAPPPGNRLQITLEDLASRNDAHEKVLGTFHQALRNQAEHTGKNTVVAVSRISTPLQSLSAAHIRILKENLWDRIAAEPAGPVKIIVELPFDSRGDYQLEFAEDLWQVIDLKKFPAGEVPELLKEFFFRRNPGRPLPALAVHLQQLRRDVRPDELPKLVALLELL